MYRTEDAFDRQPPRRPQAEPVRRRLPTSLRRSDPLEWLPPRERQIARIVYDRSQATADEVRGALGAPLSNAAVRSMLRRLESKGVLQRWKQGRKFIYMPAAPSQEAALAALNDLVARHFSGSPMDAALTLLGMLPARDQAQAGAIKLLSRLLREVELD